MTESNYESHKTLKKQTTTKAKALSSEASTHSFGVGMAAKDLGRLIKAQNRRIEETLRELSEAPDDPCLCEELRSRCLARDVFIEMLSAYLDLYDEAKDDANETESYHPFIVSG